MQIAFFFQKQQKRPNKPRFRNCNCSNFRIFTNIKQTNSGIKLIHIKKNNQEATFIPTIEPDIALRFNSKREKRKSLYTDLPLEVKKQ